MLYRVIASILVIAVIGFIGVAKFGTGTSTGTETSTASSPPPQAAPADDFSNFKIQ